MRISPAGARVGRTTRFALDFNNTTVAWLPKHGRWGGLAFGSVDDRHAELRFGPEGSQLRCDGEAEVPARSELFQLIQQIGPPAPLWRQQADLKQALYELIDPDLEIVGGLRITDIDDSGDRVFAVRLTGTAGNHEVNLSHYKLVEDMSGDLYSKDPHVTIRYDDDELGTVHHELTRYQQKLLKPQLYRLLCDHDSGLERTALEQFHVALCDDGNMSTSLRR